MGMSKEQVLQHAKTGSPVWFSEKQPENVKCGRIEDIVMKEGIQYVKVCAVKETENSVIGTVGKAFENIFPSKDLLMQAIHSEYEARKNEIQEKIQTKDDMILFLFETPVAGCGEYTDSDVKEIIQQIAWEKWRLDLR